MGLLDIDILLANGNRDRSALGTGQCPMPLPEAGRYQYFGGGDFWRWQRAFILETARAHIMPIFITADVNC